jgi:YaiO family outer membrane protein
VCVAVTLPARAQTQTQPPWGVDFEIDRAHVTNRESSTVWSLERIGAQWVVPEKGGWFGGVERHTRSDETDTAGYFRGYRRTGPWTFAGGVAASPRPAFLYNTSAEVEIARVVVRNVVAGAAYRALKFTESHVSVFQPSLSWYGGKSAVHGRLFLTRPENQKASTTLSIQATREFHTNLQAGLGGAFGARVFDVASLPGAPARARLLFGRVRIRVTHHDHLEFGATAADEQPSFVYRSVGVTYRRMWGD